MNMHNAPEPVSIPVKPEAEAVEGTERGERVVVRRKTTPQRRVSNRPIPREGFPKTIYDTQQFFGKLIPSYDPEVPKMNARDQAKYDFEQQLMRIAVLEDSLTRLIARIQRRIGVLNYKGGVGKSPLIAYMACIGQKVAIGDPFLLIDANESTGTAGDLFGVRRNETILLRQAVAEYQTLSTLTAIAERTAKHLGVRIVGSDFHKKGFPPFGQEAYERLVSTVDAAVHSVFMDTGNGFTDAANVGTVNMANALLFPAKADDPVSFSGLVMTMLKYAEEGFENKVTNGFVVINATQPGATKQEFLDKIKKELANNPYQQYNPETRMTSDAVFTLEDLGITEERMFLIPFSQHIADYNVVSTDPKVIGYDTYEALLSLLVAVYKQNASYDLVAKSRIRGTDDSSPLFQAPSASAAVPFRTTLASAVDVHAS